MATVPALKCHLRAEPAGDDAVFLIGERERFLLRGRVYRLLLPLLDGHRTADELVSALAAEISAAEVEYALRRLSQRGYLVEAGQATASPIAGFWQAIGEDAAIAAQRLAATPVAVRAGRCETAQAAADALAGAGVVVREEAALVVFVTGDYLSTDLDAWNRHALSEGIPWMLIKPGGVEPWIGPVFHPGQGPCWACLARRLRHNRPVETYLERSRGADCPPLLPPCVGLPVGRRAALDLGATLLATWIATEGAGPLGRDRLIALDLARAQITNHGVVRLPQCPVCGDPGAARARVLAPVTLEPRSKRFTDDGGHRTLTPEETFARARHLISPITGIVASLGPVEGRDHPIGPVYGSIYRVCPGGDAPSFDDFQRVSSGKGRTVAEARAGALCEAVERYSGIAQGDEPLIRARLSELGGDGVHPHDLENFSEAQYRRREADGAPPRELRREVPRPFDERVPIDWIPAWSLTHARRRYLPAAYCYLHVPTPASERFCVFNPSGHAAGNCLEEAILQGLLELVERDAVALWWYNRARRPAVDLASFGVPYFDALAAHHRDLGRRLWVLDVTTDLGIPAFVAIGRAADSGRFTIGFGCHLEARLGVQRALTELNQLCDPSGRSRSPCDDPALGAAGHLVPDETAPPRTRDDHRGVPRDDLRDDILDCVDRASRAGLETLVLDQTRPDTGIAVAAVVVPGLRHFWPRFGPGRLYDVPVLLKWLSRPNREEELNPVPLFV